LFIFQYWLSGQQFANSWIFTGRERLSATSPTSEILSAKIEHKFDCSQDFKEVISSPFYFLNHLYLFMKFLEQISENLMSFSRLKLIHLQVIGAKDIRNHKIWKSIFGES